VSQLARACACALLLLASCQSGNLGTERWPEKGQSLTDANVPRTRVEVLHTFGVPQTVSDEGTVLVYRYARGRSKGMSMGFSWNGIGLSLSNTESALDVFEVRMDAEGHVLSYDAYVGSDALHYRLWPF